MITKARLHELIDKFSSTRIAVVGDYFLDKYLAVDASLAEISLETGKIANQVVDVWHSPGAAGTIAANLVSLGATVVPVGFTGDDGDGYDLRKGLQKLGCSTDYLMTVPERFTPVYLKPREAGVAGLDGERERYDSKNRQPLPDWVSERIIETMRTLIDDVDAVIIVDQVDEAEVGVVTFSVRAALCNLAKDYPAKPFWVESRARIGTFENTILKPNQFEAVCAAFPEAVVESTCDSVMEAGRLLNERAARPVFVTRAEQGMIVFDGESIMEIAGVKLDCATDPTGAGDSATAGAMITLASGGSYVEAGVVANLVASITVCQLDTTGVAKPNEVLDRFDIWNSQIHG